MKNDKSKNIIIGLLVVIIIILGTLVALFATGTINFNSNKANDNNEQENENITNNELDEDNKDQETINSDNIYRNFLNTKEYLNNFSENEHGAIESKVSYTYYDLDNNGIEELIVNISDGYDFSTKLFYTYENDKIKFIDKFYHFGTLSYNKSENSIVYTQVKPSLAYGYSYGFYKLNNNKFELLKSVGLNINDGKETYFVNDNTISKDEYDKYFNNNIDFDFKELND